jgi:hypothetical protein
MLLVARADASDALVSNKLIAHANKRETATCDDISYLVRFGARWSLVIDDVHVTCGRCSAKMMSID